MTQHRPAELEGFGWGRMPAMADLWVEAWQEAMPEIDFEARRGWLCHRVETLLGEGALIELAVEPGAQGRLLGFVSVHPRTGYVDQLVVHPDHWGEGIALALLDAAAARTRHPLSLDVNEENRRAVHFYEKAGFTIAAHGTNPTSGRPTLRMERPAAG
jgi:putative acetyltransferase